MTKNNTEVPAGYKSSELGVIPEGWEVKRLGELVSIASGVSPSLLNLMDDGKYPYIKVEDMNNCDKYQLFSRNYSNDESYIIDANSVIFPKRGAAILNNKVRICSVPIQMDSNMMSISPKKEINVEYLYYKLTSEQLFKIADTSTIPQINNKHILPYKITLPPLEEQERIAEILGMWDRAIELQGRKVALLQSRKRALMQQLLTPHRRLPSFSEPWKTTKLGEIFAVITEINDGQSHTIMTISGKQGLISQENKFDRIIAGDSLNKYTLMRKGDFAYNKGNSKTYPMGCVYKLEKQETALVPFVYICFRATHELCTDFYKFFFLNHGLDQQLNQIITSGARGDGLLNVNKVDFMKLKVPIMSLDEQRAIAEVLTTADREIELATQNLTALRSQKRALMQQLLTGKKQVKI